MKKKIASEICQQYEEQWLRLHVRQTRAESNFFAICSRQHLGGLCIQLDWTTRWVCNSRLSSVHPTLSSFWYLEGGEEESVKKEDEEGWGL